MKQTIEEVLKDWDKNETVWSIEMGGLGPGYEQAIQIGIFELSRDLILLKLPELNKEDSNKAVNDFLDEQLHKTMKRVKELDGLSGAMAGAIKNVAYKFKADGYKKVIDSVPKDRLIQVQKKFPATV